MKKFIALLLILCFSFSNEGKTQVIEKSAKHQKIENTRLAYQLIKYGYQKENALSMISAIDILLKQNINDLYPETKGLNQIEKETKNYDYLKNILDYARYKAKNNINILTLIDQYDKELFKMKATRGAIGGARVGNHTVLAKGSNFFWVVFKENELAEVSVIGNGMNVLDLFIYDDKNNLVHKDIKRQTECYLNWYPKEKKAYKIKIKNNGSSKINYSVITN
ncbi:MAG: hypothetical protein ABFS35_14800 [Bacteroidota bacterium]